MMKVNRLKHFKVGPDGNFGFVILVLAIKLKGTMVSENVFLYYSTSAA
jgi:hypothetical protein|tara:strand:+ start:475 stop:618 length:144 start_codon:yes stop_codon:yes gene_type:complete